MPEDTLYLQLSEKLEYSKGGDFLETATLELKPPSMPVFDLSSSLSQLVMRAILDAKGMADSFEQTEESQRSGEVDAETIKMILLSSTSVQFSKVAATCKDLFVRVGTYDGSTSLKMIAFERMNINDFTNMVCEYIANFIWPSLFSGRADQKTTGDT